MVGPDKTRLHTTQIQCNTDILKHYTNLKFGNYQLGDGGGGNDHRFWILSLQK